MKRPRRPTVRFADSSKRLPFAFLNLPVRSKGRPTVVGIEAAQAGFAQLAKVLEVESDGWLPYCGEALPYVRGLLQGLES